MGFSIKALKERLSKTTDKISSGIRSVLPRGRKIDDELLEDLEEVLISADIGPEAAAKIIEEARQQYRGGKITEAEQLEELMISTAADILKKADEQPPSTDMVKPKVITIVGVNGTGKTTSIAKLAKYYMDDGKTVLLAACDTFRAAAVEQLTIWADRVGADIVKHGQGSDPAAVAFDAISAAKSRGRDVVIIDTAGRLHTKSNLMEELKKIHRVANKAMEGAPHESLLVIDGTTGQNGLAQIKLFDEAVHLTGLILTKMDGTAKGGVVLAAATQYKIPVRYIGLGERAEDFDLFEPEKFATAIFQTKNNA
ncbi:MAG: signal recognition particle-docking protein FtsY [candidate division Zixibacteria bacterium]|nr:signal recognition particle-docking protein FtsY [candidate division Zixibacteria bacterium]